MINNLQPFRDAKTQTMVMTALMEDGAFAHFNGLRRLHFPPHRNKVPAHISLFHTLPLQAIDLITAVIRTALATLPDCQASTTGVRFLGHGVAYTVEAPGLTAIRTAIAAACSEWLTPQDRQAFRPHITIQNKADPALARALFDLLSAEFQPMRFSLTGLRLWNYSNGLWSQAATEIWPTISEG